MLSFVVCVACCLLSVFLVICVECCFLSVLQDLLLYILQLVQALKYENFEEIAAAYESEQAQPSAQYVLNVPATRVNVPVALSLSGEDLDRSVHNVLADWWSGTCPGWCRQDLC